MNDTIYTSKKGRFKLTSTQLKAIVAAGAVVAAGGTWDQIRIGEVRENTDMFDQHMDVIRDRLSVVEAFLTETNSHAHLWSGWSDPVQLPGNFPTPVWQQTRHCKICGLGEKTH